MKKFIPKQKLSKKARRALNAECRKIWTINPLTKCADIPRAYNRNKTKKANSAQLCEEYAYN